MKPTPLGPFVGINNRAPAHRLHIGERGQPGRDALRNAVNVDLTASETLQRRPGTVKEVSTTDAHSLWGNDELGYYVDAGTLYRFPRVALRTGLTPGMRVSFAATPRGVVWSNGVLLELITGDASAPLAPSIPNPTPLAVPAASGSLPAGLYQVAFTAVGADGSESGTTWPQQVGVDANGSIVIAGLPGTRIRVYMSPVNGDVLFLVADTSAANITLPVFNPIDTQPTTLGLRPMPAGHIVREFNGRLLVASGDTLYISEPYAYGLYNPIRGFIPLGRRIEVVEPVSGGVYICAGKTYWLAGADPLGATLDDRLTYGGVEGTGGTNPLTKEAYWFSPQGLVVGDDSGKVRNVQEATVAVDAATIGAQMFRDQNGLRQVVSSLFGGQASSAAATSFMDAEIIRKESML